LSERASERAREPPDAQRDNVQLELCLVERTGVPASNNRHPAGDTRDATRDMRQSTPIHSIPIAHPTSSHSHSPPHLSRSLVDIPNSSKKPFSSGTLASSRPRALAPSHSFVVAYFLEEPAVPRSQEDVSDYGNRPKQNIFEPNR
jgi:hypothetical protein